jgi:cytochrome c biogenesis protein ResB
VRVYDKSGATSELEEGELLAEKRILVNEPLSLKGSHGFGQVRLYQASWGATGMLNSATLALGSRTLEVPMKSKTRLPGTDVMVQVDMMLPNFTVGKDNRPDTLSLEPVNPAVQVTFYQKGTATAPLWLVQNFPGVAFSEDENGFLHQAPPPPFRLAAISPVVFSGLQVAYDPGIPVLYAGFAMFLGGLCALFYLHRRKVFVWVGGGKVVVGGWSSRKDAFRREFGLIVDALKTEMG